MAKAYLHLTVAVDKHATPILDASIEDRPIDGPGVAIPGPGERRVMLLEVEAETFEAARLRLLRLVQGEERCEAGDLRFLWRFLDPDADEAARNQHRRDVHLAALLLPSDLDGPVGPPPWSRR